MATGTGDGAAEQGDEADEAFGGTNPRAASGAQPEVPPHARDVRDCRGHRFAAYPPCSADTEAQAHGLNGLETGNPTDTCQAGPNEDPDGPLGSTAFDDSPLAFDDSSAPFDDGS
jgi:hypothetical protein